VAYVRCASVDHRCASAQGCRTCIVRPSCQTLIISPGKSMHHFPSQLRNLPSVTRSIRRKQTHGGRMLRPLCLISRGKSPHHCTCDRQLCVRPLLFRVVSRRVNYRRDGIEERIWRRQWYPTGQPVPCSDVMRATSEIEVWFEPWKLKLSPLKVAMAAFGFVDPKPRARRRSTGCASVAYIIRWRECSVRDLR